MNKSKSIFSWIMRVLISLGFILASVGKLTNNPQVIEMFKNWRYPDGFHFFIGVLEITLAILLLIPKTLKIAIFGLTAVMIGALITHIIYDPPLNLFRPIIFLAFLGGVYFIKYFKKPSEH